MGCMVLSLVFSAIALFSYKAYERVRFTRASQKVIAKIREKKLQALVEDKDLTELLTWSGTMFFNGQIVQGIQMTFYSNGSVRPEGKIRLEQGGMSVEIT